MRNNTESWLPDSGEYRSWIAELKRRYRVTQIKAAMSVNTALLEYYWNLGKDISERYADAAAYGMGFFDHLSADMKSAMPGADGFSPRNLRYCQRFYELYKSEENLPQLVAELVRIPWGHHRFIIDKCSDCPAKALFYVRRTIQNEWSRDSLLNWISTDLYGREGRAQTNFAVALPSPDSDLAQQLTKDPYVFAVQGLTERYREAELKRALVENVEKLLVELGRGFAFVGREYVVATEETEQRIDLLFYLIPQHRYVVVEVKTGKFETSYLGQLAGYVALVNAKLNTSGDNPAIGLLVCKERDATLVRYVLDQVAMPIGVSNYELSQALPNELRSDLPSIEELEAELDGAESSEGGDAGSEGSRERED